MVLTREELIDELKHTVRDTADILLAEEGVGSHELGYLYNIIMDHVRMKMLDGKSAGAASAESLKHALRQRHNLSRNFKEKPGLVASIVKYRKAT
ncbi:MAG: Helicase ATP-binding protein [Bacteroidetes bacterium]|nr:Helicase ATP-binding protein [Bacteroidota bacterium]